MHKTTGQLHILLLLKSRYCKGDEKELNPSGLINRASMASMLVNAYKLERNENIKLPKEFADLNNH